MEQQKEPTLEDQVGQIHRDVKALADKLGIDYKEVLSLLTHREIVILNLELRRIHEMFDLLFEKKAKKKGRR